jgi:hypothetical protein
MFGALLGAWCVTKLSSCYDCGRLVRDDPKLPSDREEVPISEWSGWQFNSRCKSSLYLMEKTTR